MALALGLGQEIGLVQHQPAFASVEPWAVLFQFLSDGADRLSGLADLAGRVRHLEQEAGALEVLQELDPEPRARRRAGHEAGHIGHHEAMVDVHRHHAEVRVQGREGVVGDLRVRRRDGPDEARLPRVRQADQADIGEHGQLQAQSPRFPRLAFGGLARCTVGAGLEARIAPAVEAAMGHEQALLRRHQVPDQLVRIGIISACPGRDADHEIAPGAARALCPGPRLSRFGLEAPLITELDEGVETPLGDQIDAAAIAAVSAIGSAPRDVLLTAETQAAMAAGAGLHLDDRAIDEFHGEPPRSFPMRWHRAHQQKAPSRRGLCVPGLE